MCSHDPNEVPQGSQRHVQRCGRGCSFRAGQNGPRYQMLKHTTELLGQVDAKRSVIFFSPFILIWEPNFVFLDDLLFDLTELGSKRPPEVALSDQLGLI